MAGTRATRLHVSLDTSSNLFNYIYNSTYIVIFKYKPVVAPYAAVGAAYNSTFSIRCPVSGQLILLQSLNYITPAMDCNVYKDQAHTSEFFVSNICKLHSSCSFSVTNKNVVFFPITVCTPNPYMYLKAEYQCS